MQDISISRFQPWIMQEIPQKSIKQPIRITPIRKTRTAMKKIRHSSSRWMRQQPSLALQPHRLQTIPRQTAMEILFPKQAVEQLQAVQEHQPSSPRVREILLRIPTRAVTARLLKKARNFIQFRLHQKRYFIW